MFGTTVVVVDAESGKQIRYKLVGEYEADPAQQVLSITSPIGRALVGKEVGDEVTVRTPGGNRTFEILEILP